MAGVHHPDALTQQFSDETMQNFVQEAARMQATRERSMWTRFLVRLRLRRGVRRPNDAQSEPIERGSSKETNAGNSSGMGVVPARRRGNQNDNAMDASQSTKPHEEQPRSPLREIQRAGMERRRRDEERSGAVADGRGHAGRRGKGSVGSSSVEPLDTETQPLLCDDGDEEEVRMQTMPRAWPRPWTWVDELGDNNDEDDGDDGDEKEDEETEGQAFLRDDGDDEEVRVQTMPRAWPRPWTWVDGLGVNEDEGDGDDESENEDEDGDKARTEWIRSLGGREYGVTRAGLRVGGSTWSTRSEDWHPRPELVRVVDTNLATAAEEDLDVDVDVDVESEEGAAARSSSMVGGLRDVVALSRRRRDEGESGGRGTDETAGTDWRREGSTIRDDYLLFQTGGGRRRRSMFRGWRRPRRLSPDWRPLHVSRPSGGR